MDFNDSPEEAQFRREARAFLEGEATEYRDPPPRGLAEDQRVHAAKSWQGIKARNGFAAILWPKELGGRGGTPMQQAIFNEEEARYHTPKSSLTLIGIGMAIPTLVAHGTPEQLAHYAPPTADGRLTWCQLFSEPSAGTDLGALRTRAERDGSGDKGGWVINGQKVWTSWAHRADIAILVARTDSSVPKHKGLTYFILDMKTPGVKATPIRKMSGGAEFNQVFLTDVRIPDSMRVGAVGDGWKVAMTTLMNERFGTGGGSGNLPKVQDLLALAQRRGRADDPGLRQTLARLYAEQQGMKYTRYRSLTQLSRGRTPGQEGAILKLSLARHLQELTALAIDIDNEAGMLGADENPELADYQYNYLHSIALRIAGGTDEVLRTQIGERMLGMPAEARVDKNVPFKDLPV
jgi:alkylation response protein AidB-like acyl-CoA dehydrogenase